MPELNVNLPPIEVWIPWERLHSEELPSDPWVQAHFVSASSVEGQALGFQVLTRDDALYERLQISDLWSERILFPHRGLGVMGLPAWDCPGYNVTWIVYDALEGLAVNAKLPYADDPMTGNYRGTFDWYGDPVSDGVGDLGHKAAHLIALDNGQFALLPNDRLAWHSPAWTETFNWGDPPRYKRNRRIYRIEGN